MSILPNPIYRQFCTVVNTQVLESGCLNLTVILIVSVLLPKFY